MTSELEQEFRKAMRRPRNRLRIILMKWQALQIKIGRWLRGN